MTPYRAHIIEAFRVSCPSAPRGVGGRSWTLLWDDIEGLGSEEGLDSTTAVRVLRDRIGGWVNLLSYCDTLAAGNAHKPPTEKQGGAK